VLKYQVAEDYRVFFEAIVFTITRSGFRPRCALETDDASQIRFEKIAQIIAECRYGIHDISRTELDPHNLPRFNMPLELGLFLGAKRFGVGVQKRKRCIVFDKEPYRYQKLISDISGQDVHSHDARSDDLIEKAAAWLRTQSGDTKVPGGRKIAEEFNIFQSHLAKICAGRSLHPDELTFGDYARMVEEYLALTA
jgi:hypothetical protein